MVLQEALHRLQLFRSLVRGGSEVSQAASNITRSSKPPATAAAAGRHFARRRRYTPPPYDATSRRTTGLDVARFALISIATLPFSLWVAIFSYNYAYRIHLCQDALGKEDEEVSYGKQRQSSNNNDTTTTTMIGRQKQLTEVQTLLEQPPHQILVVAGGNESGKSRFVFEILKSVPIQRGITYLQLAQIVDSLSTLTHALVRAFDLRWLHMRHSLVDVLPFAGSEILVMKERFSDRDLAQALLVITEALKAKASKSKPGEAKPVFIIDGLGEGSAWIRSPEGRGSLQRLLKWCIYITKERRLAHVLLTGNEELVISLTGQNQITRGHVKVIGLADLSPEEAAHVVRQEIADASPVEIKKITDMFGGFIHDIQTVSREIQSRMNHSGNNIKYGERVKIFEDVISARFRLHIERVTAAFAKGRGEEDDHSQAPSKEASEKEKDEMDPYLDPLKAVYSEATAAEHSSSGDSDWDESRCSWSQLQLWQTLQRLVESDDPNMSVPFADLRDDIFDGDITPLLELMNEDVLGFEVESKSASSGEGWSWEVKPATPALRRVFHHLINNSHLKERFQGVEEAQQSLAQLRGMEQKRSRLRRERRWLDLRKESLLKTVELGKELRVNHDEDTQHNLENVYASIVTEEVTNERRGQEIRHEFEAIMKEVSEKEAATKNAATSSKQEQMTTQGREDPSSIQEMLKAAILKNYIQAGSQDKFERFRNSFQALDVNRTGTVKAEDVVRLIKTTTGEVVDMEAAESFIQAWDVDNDKNLDYDEFVRMILTDPKNSVKQRATATSKE